MPHERGADPNRDYERNFDAVVAQYFSGRLAGAARIEFEAWLHEVPSRWNQVEQLRAIWEVSAEVPAGVSDAGVDEALGQVKHRIRDRQAAAARSRPVLKLELRRTATGGRWFGTVPRRVAAAVLMAVGGGLLWRAAESRPVSLPQAPQPAAHIYATARGERAVVTLPDGSVVTLHNESTLEMPIDFGVTTRDVRLRGEGYFEVAHDRSRPFQVHSGGATARVLGTKFDIRARAGEATRVAVLEGRVAVGADFVARDAPVLTAGHVARLGGAGRFSVDSGVDVERLLSWTTGRLVFEHAPLPEVVAELSRWFDRDIVLGDSTLATLRLHTELGGQSLAEAIHVLETALDVRATVHGRQIVLTRS